jgi:hypothetical protein
MILFRNPYLFSYKESLVNISDEEACVLLLRNPFAVYFSLWHSNITILTFGFYFLYKCEF